MIVSRYKHRIVWALGLIILLVFSTTIKDLYTTVVPKNVFAYYIDDKKELRITQKGKQNSYPFELLRDIKFDTSVSSKNMTPVGYISETYLTKIKSKKKATYTLYATATDGSYILQHKDKYKHIQIGDTLGNDVLTLFKIEGAEY